MFANVARENRDAENLWLEIVARKRKKQKKKNTWRMSMQAELS
jgi:hypothetical protein